ncbi:MAG: hypothetical protein ACRENJ_01030 [Candidatus Eiseniibacteriota bacterium]
MRQGQDHRQGLWVKLTNEQYTVAGAEWSEFPGKSGIYEPDQTLLGSDPHLGPALFRTFVNGPARTALAANTFRLPDGAIIAKQNYTVVGTDTALAAITVMLKRSGYNPGGQGLVLGQVQTGRPGRGGGQAADVHQLPPGRGRPLRRRPRLRLDTNPLIGPLRLAGRGPAAGESRPDRIRRRG